jgi:uncharacterized repeat protein (TIGR02543 family)
MARRVAGCGVGLLVAVFALTLGVTGAGGHSLATTTILVQVIGQGSVTGTGGTINCGDGATLCYFTTTATSGSVTLTATPDSGWSFSPGWSQACGGTSTCELTLDGSNYEATATFSTTPLPGTSTLSVDVTGDSADKGGTVRGGGINCDPSTTDCTWEVTTGSTVTLLQTADSGYVFTGWGGVCAGTDTSCTVSMDADKSLNAAFAASATNFTLTVSVSGDGTVTGGGIGCTSAGGAGCSASQTANSTVTLTATPGSGASFTGWGGACAGSTLTCTVTMDAAKSVTAAFSGAGGGTGSTFPLSVSVTGSGNVSGGGVNCGNGGSTCIVNVAANTTVTLTAAPGSGATFTSWGGACSGSVTTCTLTMNAAKNVSATFSGTTPGPGNELALTVVVRGKGSVTASGGACTSSGAARSCKQSYGAGSSIELTAAPAAGAKFLGWAGSCRGTAAACTIELTASATVEATFSGATAGAALATRGRPIVGRGKAGFRVTLRFRAHQSGIARVRAIRAGRIETALAFSVGPGPGSVGPLLVQKPGYYRFDLRLGARAIEWHACLGRCGESAPGGPFTVVREPSVVVRAGEAWSVTVRFHANRLSGAELRISRGKRLVNDLEFASPAGEVRAGPFVLSPGAYTLRLKVTDAYGRTRRLSWFAFLPG